MKAGPRFTILNWKEEKEEGEGVCVRARVDEIMCLAIETKKKMVYIHLGQVWYNIHNHCGHHNPCVLGQRAPGGNEEDAGQP